MNSVHADVIRTETKILFESGHWKQKSVANVRDLIGVAREIGISRLEETGEWPGSVLEHLDRRYSTYT